MSKAFFRFSVESATHAAPVRRDRAPPQRDASLQQCRSCCFIDIRTMHFALPNDIALRNCVQRSNPALVIRNRCFPRCTKR
ncbi:hypothetical protein BSLA_03r0085 [Burkholderia stabilis]|nr:hypothetical protein BSLA_03r0085 [Burkholderia stabilis]